MKYLWILILAASPCVFAQDGGGNVVFSRAVGPISAEQIGGTVSVSSASEMPGAVIQGAPYSATITNQSIQTLGDGNRIVQTSTGTIARDSLGRTRRDVALPAIGGLSAANAPHLVFIQDPTTQTSYTLNLTDKTAQKLPVFSAMVGGPGAPGGPTVIQMGSVATAGGPLPPPPAGQAVFAQQFFTTNDQAQTSTEDLGSRRWKEFWSMVCVLRARFPPVRSEMTDPFKLLPRSGRRLTSRLLSIANAAIHEWATRRFNLRTSIGLSRILHCSPSQRISRSSKAPNQFFIVRSNSAQKAECCRISSSLGGFRYSGQFVAKINSMGPAEAGPMETANIKTNNRKVIRQFGGYWKPKTRPTRNWLRCRPCCGPFRSSPCLPR